MFKLIDDPRVIIYDCHRFIIQATGDCSWSGGGSTGGSGSGGGSGAGWGVGYRGAIKEAPLR